MGPVFAPLVVLVVLGVSPFALAEIRLQQADRKIDLTSQFVRTTENLKFKNVGDKAVDRLTLCTLTALVEKTSYLKVLQNAHKTVVAIGRRSSVSSTCNTQ